MPSLKRVVLFIDHGNLFHGLLELNIRIDYAKFMFLVTKKRLLVKTFIYLGVPNYLFDKKLGFIKYLINTGLDVQMLPLKINHLGKKKQRGVDLYIYRNMTELARDNEYDVAVLVSGDGDLLMAVNQVMQLDKDVEIYSFRASLAKSLITEVGMEKVTYIDDIIEKIKVPKKKKKKESKH